LAKAGDDEQGVVDPDADADHRRERRREARHGDEAGEDGDYQDARAEAEEGGQDWHPHCDDGPEGDNEDYDGREHADQLCRSKAGPAVDVDAAADLDAEVRAGGIGPELREGIDAALWELSLLRAVLDGNFCDGAIFRQGARLIIE